METYGVVGVCLIRCGIAAGVKNPKKLLVKFFTMRQVHTRSGQKLVG